MKPMILIHSNDADFYLVFSHILEADGFSCELAATASVTAAKSLESKPGAIILDSQDEDDGTLQLCVALKQHRDLRQIPVVALITASAAARHLEFLEAGIDECFVRPFAPARLLAYLRTTLDPAPPGDDGVAMLSHGGIQLNRQTHRVHCNGREIHLPPIEFRLLLHLLEAEGRICTREELMSAAWQVQDGSPDLRGVDTRIARLRKKLKDALEVDIIRTVRAAGYGLKDAPVSK